jgi:cytochrome b
MTPQQERAPTAPPAFLETASAAQSVEPAQIKVWDVFVRLFHWSLVGLFALAFLTSGDGELPHQLAGGAVAALVSARIVWGFRGPRHARFASFLRGPGEILAFLRQTLRFAAPRHLGHNPAGGLMVAALLATMLALAATGLPQILSAFDGVSWIGKAHKAAAFLALGLIGLHLIGVIVASLEHREDLVRAMLTGFKRAPAPGEGAQPSSSWPPSPSTSNASGDLA